MPVEELIERASLGVPESPTQSSGQPDEGVRIEGLSPIPGNKTARFLGWFSIGLGAVEILFPRRLARIIGAPERPFATRLMGFREVAVGVGILGTPRPSAWLKARVAGDAMDLAALKSAFGQEESSNTRLACTTAAVAAITALDLVSARQLAKTEPASGRIRIETSRAVNKSPRECYDFWRQVENLPRFMNHVESVRVTGEKTSHWKLKPISMKSLEWNTRLTNDVPGEMIEWQSIGDSDVQSSGSVRFEPRLSGQGTNVRFSMEYAPPLTDAESITGRLLKSITETKLREDVRRFKNLIECGEIPTTEGQTSGREAFGHEQPTQRRVNR